jgi:PAS domain S-box-containing protein
VLCVAIATAARFGLGLIESGLVPFATYFPAVLVSALFFGVEAGIAATVLSIIAAWWLFVEPQFRFTPVSARDVVNLGIFVAVNAIIIWMAQSLRNARAQLLTSVETSSTLTAIVSYSGDAIVGFAMDSTVTSWNASAEQLFGYSADEIIGKPLSALVPPERQEEPKRMFPRSSSGEILKFETQRLKKSGERVDVAVSTGPIVSAEGKVVGVSAIFSDISGRKQREQHLDFVLRELSHRAKNLLAVVQAIARQTARQSESPQDFERRFGDRLQALAHSQDILVEREWRGATLEELVNTQMTPFAEVKSRVVTAGPSVLLPPQAAEKIGIALHELSTNAVKHGALSVPAGSVTVSWVLEIKDDKSDQLRIEWREQNGPPVTQPVREGFGTVVMTRLVPTALNATAQIDYNPQGLVWTLVMPLANAASAAA